MEKRIQHWRTDALKEEWDLFLKFKKVCGLGGTSDENMQSLELTYMAWGLLQLEHENVITRETCEDFFHKLGFTTLEVEEARELWEDVHFA